MHIFLEAESAGQGGFFERGGLSTSGSKLIIEMFLWQCLLSLFVDWGVVVAVGYGVTNRILAFYFIFCLHVTGRTRRRERRHGA